MPARKLLPAKECRILQAVLNGKIAEEHQERKLGLRTAEISRVTIVKAEVIPAGDGRDVIQPDPVANAGNTINKAGILILAAILASNIFQGTLADCVLLASILSWLFADPNFSEDLVYLTSDSSAVAQYWIGGAILRIHTSLVVSTSYNEFDVPGDQQNLVVEIMEKTWGFARSGINDYLKDNFAGGGDVFSAWGLDANIMDLSLLQQSLAEGKLAVFITGSATGTDSAGHPYIGSHCYAVKSFDGVNCVMQNPWWGGTDITVTADFIRTAGWWIGPYVAAIPKPKRLLAPAVVAPTPTPVPTPTTEAAALAQLVADVAALKAAVSSLLSVRST